MSNHLNQRGLKTQIELLMAEGNEVHAPPFGYDFDGHEIYLYVDVQQIPHLVINLADEDDPLNHDKTETIRIETVPWRLPHHSEPRLCINCYLTEDSQSLIRGFCLLLDYIFTEIIEGKHPRKAVEDSLDFLMDFFKLASTGMSHSARIGLFGELLWLERLAKVDPEESLRIWQGDRRSSKDFSSDFAAVEVKTSVQTDDLSVKINSYQQLTSNEGQDLYLSLIRLDEGVNENARTIPKLIDDLTDCGIDRNLLLDRLANSSTYSYYEVDRDLYERTYYSVHDEFLFSVNNQFPAITSDDLESDLLERVKDLQYTISLEGLEHCQVPIENYDDVIKGLRQESA